MHEHGIAHLDACPRNILCKSESTRVEDIHICDFGGSQYFSEPIEEALCYYPTALHDFPESPFQVCAQPKPFNPFAADVYGIGFGFLQYEEVCPAEPTGRVATADLEALADA